MAGASPLAPLFLALLVGLALALVTLLLVYRKRYPAEPLPAPEPIAPAQPVASTEPAAAAEAPTSGAPDVPVEAASGPGPEDDAARKE